ncbi:MAG TPA: DUF2845 domain-containing protein [Thermodesulfovibrionales bacterium]|nr:DUF2845 domain-containing protein [Thermodesulfovibrionales bacterium]
MNKKIFLHIAFPLCTVLAALTPSFAMRCGNNLVDVGATKIEVLSKCGEPTLKEEVGEDFSRQSDNRDTRRERRYVEKWTYNFGTNRFIYVLTIKDGKVIDISTEDKGF